MTGLDTNVVLDWILNEDDPPTSRSDTFRISLVVLAEIVWVLERQFKNKRTDVANVVEGLLDLPHVSVANRRSVIDALKQFRTGPADFADYLIMNDNRSSGCATTLTYDKKAGRSPGFTLLRKSI